MGVCVCVTQNLINMLFIDVINRDGRSICSNPHKNWSRKSLAVKMRATGLSCSLIAQPMATKTETPVSCGQNQAISLTLHRMDALQWTKREQITPFNLRCARVHTPFDRKRKTFLIFSNHLPCMWALCRELSTSPCLPTVACRGTSMAHFYYWKHISVDEIIYGVRCASWFCCYTRFTAR